MKNHLTLKPIFLVLAFIAFFHHNSNAQVGIGTITPDGALDLNSDEEKNGGTNTYGLVLPRVVLSKVNEAAPVINPVTGLNDIPIGTVVYNTVTTNFDSNSVYPGIYMWNGSSWINKFPKKDAEIFKQDNSGGALRTSTTAGYQNIPGLISQIFTPEYSGTYKIELSVNWGGGYVDNSGFGTDVAVMSGIFKLTFDGVDELFPAHTWSGRHGGGTQYYDIWEQSTVILYKELVANTAYNFGLSFDQTVADGFLNNGNSGDGMGWLGGDIPCTIEFIYLD